MDIYTYLQNDHRVIQALMDKVPQASNAGERVELFDRLKDELDLHTDIESKSFYRALVRRGDREILVSERQAEIEHETVRKLTVAVDHADAGSAEWLSAFDELKQAVNRHIQTEETTIFDQARKILSSKQAAELATEVDALKRQRALQRSAGHKTGDFISRMFGQA